MCCQLYVQRGLLLWWGRQTGNFFFFVRFVFAWVPKETVKGNHSLLLLGVQLPKDKKDGDTVNSYRRVGSLAVLKEYVRFQFIE